MIKQFLISIAIVALLTACSFKLPDFLTFSSSVDNIALLKEANVCQDMESEATKLKCYENIESSNSFAMIRLGTYFSEKKDFQKALKYLNQAKASENFYANLPLAMFYFKGEGIKKDINRSFELLKESQDRDPVAAFQLSKFYLQGINTKIDNEKGVELLNFSAQEGVFQAQEILSSIYKQGLYGQAKDQIKSDYWLKKAEENRDDLNYKVYIF